MKWLPIVTEKAFAQHGVIARFQLEKLGIPPTSQSRILAGPLFKKSAPATYSLASAPNTWRHMASVAVLSSGPGVYLSHESALINMGLLSETDRRSRNGTRSGIHIMSSRRMPKRKNVISHYSRYFDDEYSTLVHQGIPQVELGITIVDSAARLTDEQLASVVDNAIRRRILNPRELLPTLYNLRKSSSRETVRLIALLEDHISNAQDIEKSESVLETRVQRVLRRHLKVHTVPQYELSLGKGSYRVDLAIVESRIAIEVDGFAFHRNRTSHDSDRYRQNNFVAAGWKVIRITSAFTNEEIVGAIRPLLGSQSG